MADAGSPDNKTVPNQQDSTTGPNKRQAATDFPMYEKLPAELQTMIWTEALRTPCVEYGRLERVDQPGSQTWTVKLQRQPAKNAARSSSGLAGEVSRLTAAGKGQGVTGREQRHERGPRAEPTSGAREGVS